MKPGLLAITAGAAALPFSLWAGRPLVVDDPFTVPPGRCEFEAGFHFENHSNLRHFDAPFGLTLGLLPTLETSLGFGSRMDYVEESLDQTRIHCGVGDLVVGFKWNPFSETDHWASHGLALGIKIPAANHRNGLGSGKTDYDLTYICARNLTDRLAVNLNTGYTFIGDASGQRDHDILHSGVALGYRVTDRFELVAEVFDDLCPLSSGEAVVIRGGSRWMIRDSLTLDAAIGTGLHGSAPDLVATTGFTWAFDIPSWPKRKN
ncbi:MAG TPA: transporter [Candidatus Paceibacterota bacterium]|nr:transporter [Candidatus Paceibacterota bacterium]